MFRRTCPASKPLLLGASTSGLLNSRKRSFFAKLGVERKKEEYILESQLKSLLDTVNRRDSRSMSKTEAEALQDAATQLALVAASADFKKSADSPIAPLATENKKERRSKLKRGSSFSSLPSPSRKQQGQEATSPISGPLEAAKGRSGGLPKSTKKRMPLVAGTTRDGTLSKTTQVPDSPLARGKSNHLTQVAARQEVEEENGYSTAYDVYTVHNQENESRKEKALLARLMQLEEEVSKLSPATKDSATRTLAPSPSSLAEPKRGEVVISLDVDELIENQSAAAPINEQDLESVLELENQYAADFTSTFDVYADELEDMVKKSSHLKGQVSQESVLSSTRIGRTPFRGGVCQETGNGFFACDLSSVTNNLGTNKEFAAIPGTEFVFCGYTIANFVSTWKLKKGLTVETPRKVGDNLYFSCFNIPPRSGSDKSREFSDDQRQQATEAAEKDKWKQSVTKEDPITTLVFSFEVEGIQTTSKGPVSIGGFGPHGLRMSTQARSGSSGGYVSFMNEPTYLLGGSFTVMRLENIHQQIKKEKKGRSSYSKEELTNLALEAEQQEYFDGAIAE